jgi:hypothetical protein
MSMRRICLALFSAFLATGAALAQFPDAPATLYVGADVVFDGRLGKIVPSPNGLTAHFL